MIYFVIRPLQVEFFVFVLLVKVNLIKLADSEKPSTVAKWVGLSDFPHLTPVTSYEETEYPLGDTKLVPNLNAMLVCTLQSYVYCKQAQCKVNLCNL